MEKTSQALFFLHLLQFPRRYESEMMSRLKARGHAELRLSFAPVISALARTNMRLTELADALGMQKQNCLQLLKQIEKAGYIERAADPDDGRARLLRLSEAGRQLVRDGLEEVRQIDRRFEDAVGEEAFNTFGSSLDVLCQALDLDVVPGDTLLNRLSKLAAYAGTALNALVRESGHTDIRPVHEKVLLYVGEGLVRIHDIARANDVSRQSISGIVSELKDFGYIALDIDAFDRRSRVIRLTDRGHIFVEESAYSAANLLGTFQLEIGHGAFVDVQQTLAICYALLGDIEAAPTVAEQDDKQGLAKATSALLNVLEGDGTPRAEAVLGRDKLKALQSLLLQLGNQLE